MSQIIVITLSVLVLLLIRPITILIHEMGHSIPALLFTKKKVSAYIGSYGEQDYNVRLNAGRLSIYLKTNPFYWDRGLCSHGEVPSVDKHIIVVLGGPMASLIMLIICAVTMMSGSVSEWVRFVSAFFMFSFIFDFYLNIIPDNRVISMADGSVTYNDGKQLRQLIQIRPVYEEIKQGEALIKAEKHQEARNLFTKLIESGHKSEVVYRFAIYLAQFQNDHIAVADLFAELRQIGNLDDNDYINIAHQHTLRNDYAVAIEFLNKAVQINPENPLIYNNRGYIYNLMGNYQRAIVNSDIAIKMVSDFAYPYNNRGFAKIKLGQVEEGLRDIKKSIELDTKNAYAHRNLGIYHFDKGEFNKALAAFEKAWELDKETHLLEQYLKETSSKINT